MERYVVRTMKLAIRIALLAFFSMSWPALCAAVQITEASEKSRQEARRLWEQAVAAKGGRERLHQVNSLAVSYKSERRWLFKKYRQNFERLYVFPNKCWEWLDDVPPLGLTVRVADLDRHVGWTVYDIPNPSPSRSADPKKLAEFYEDYIDRSQFLYLMETRWVKPELLHATQDWIGLKKVDIVHTIVGEWKVDFYLDRKTHLPQRVVILSNISDRAFLTYSPSDYAPVNGIQMPHKESGGRLSFQINPAYNEGVFLQKPSLEAGPHAWR